MIDKDALCERIREIYPDIGVCGIDIKTEYDEDQGTWVVHLKKDNHKLKTYLEDGDADRCMLGEMCFGLSVEVAQLIGNIERMPTHRDKPSQIRRSRPSTRPGPMRKRSHPVA